MEAFTWQITSLISYEQITFPWLLQVCKNCVWSCYCKSFIASLGRFDALIPSESTVITTNVSLFLNYAIAIRKMWWSVNSDECWWMLTNTTQQFSLITYRAKLRINIQNRKRQVFRKWETFDFILTYTCIWVGSIN